jgi:transcriptional regulator with XRE-family HTH domain
VKKQQAFGEALRRHRERSGVTLESIASQTKISVALLKALENGDCSRWPTGIYSRSYVREYAVAIGLDPDDLASQFSACFSQTAFPDGPPKKEAADVPRVEPLRLTLVPEPAARMRMVWRRAALVSLDLVLMLILATALRMTVVGNVWMALGGVTLVCQSLGLAAGGRSAADLFAWISRTPPAPVAEEAPQESPVVEGV